MSDVLRPSGSQPARAPSPGASAQHAGALALFALGCIALVWLCLPSWTAMTDLWWNNETYTHGMLVPAASAWLAWRIRDRWYPLTPSGSLVGLIVMAGSVAAWLVGTLAGVNALEQFAAVTMIIALFLAIFGWPTTKVLAFPLGFLFFAVPFGDFLMPWLMDRTADFTVKAVELSGVPVLREGRNFVLPSGRWSVVEACSGLRYLLAAVPLGMLYAHLSFRSWRTRWVYVGLVIAIALVANWLRAYGIVMLGHASSMTIAAGADHLIYGWLFFGVVMGLAFTLGARMPELGPPDAPVRSPAAAGTVGSGHPKRVAFAAIACLLAATGPALAGHLSTRGEARVNLAALRSALSSDMATLGEYRPNHPGGRDSVVGRVPGDPAIGLAAYQYHHQYRGTEMITHGHGPMPASQEALAWSLRRQSTTRVATLPGAPDGTLVNEYVFEHRDRRWLVWEWFWVAGTVTHDPRRAKIETALSIFAGRGDESVAWYAWVMVSPSDPQAAEQALNARLGTAAAVNKTLGLAGMSTSRAR